MQANRQKEKLASRHNHFLLSAVQTSQGQEVQLGLVAPSILHRDFCLQQPAGDGEFWLDLSLSTTAF